MSAVEEQKLRSTEGFQAPLLDEVFPAIVAAHRQLGLNILRKRRSSGGGFEQTLAAYTVWLCTRRR